MSLELEKKGKRILTLLCRDGSIRAKKKKMGINIEAFIQSATMQMKAQNAPGEQNREQRYTREPPEQSGGVGEGWLHSHRPQERLCTQHLLDF